MSAFCVRLMCAVLVIVCGSLALAQVDSARAEWLRKEIARHDELYFKKAAPEITDAEYDRLKQELQTLENEGAAAIGDDRSGDWPVKRHRVPMLSLEKVYSASELSAWLEKAERKVGGEARWVVEPKYDGVAIGLTYKDGKFVSAVTRGNGREGDEVTANVLATTDVPRQLTGSAPARVEIRGEIFMSRAEFARLNTERAEAGEEPLAHPRNAAAGTLKSKDADEVAKRRLRLVCYGLGAWEGAGEPATQRALAEQLKVWGLPAPEQTAGLKSEEVWAAVEAFGRAKDRLEFPVDGAVVKLDLRSAQRELGVGETAPRWAVAFKFAPERVSTRLRAITLQVGRTGAVTPVAELEPVTVGGAMVARATLHNIDEISRRDLRVGDWVFLERAGEVIPAITGVDLARRATDAVPFAAGEACPVCAQAWARGDGALRCGNARCPARVRRSVEFYASRAGVGINGLGPALVEKLVEAGKVASVADLYRLTRDDGVSAKVLAEIEKSRRAELARVIAGVGLPGVGKKKAEELAARFGSLSKLAESDAVDAEGREAIRALVAAGVNS